MTTGYQFSIRFADAETPARLSGQYVLAQSPMPPVSLQVFRNGVLQCGGADYQLVGPLVRPLSGWDPDDVIVCFYRF